MTMKPVIVKRNNMIRWILGAVLLADAVLIGAAVQVNACAGVVSAAVTINAAMPPPAGMRRVRLRTEMGWERRGRKPAVG